MQVGLEQVDKTEVGAFRSMVAAYWLELMPQSPVVRDGNRAEAYFAERFAWDGGSGHPYWATADGDRVGFVMFKVADDGRRAQIHDFFIVEEQRRRGTGSRIWGWVH